MPDSVCSICSGKIEDPGRRDGDDSSLKTCYGCFLAGLIPKDYQDRECYAYDTIWKHQNATAKPRTGVAILDTASAPRISETMLACKNKPRIR